MTETILTYAKLRTAEKDMQIALTDLRDVCNLALREEMELLIAADIGILIDGQASVYTDSKLLVFILKQLLINCAKYCSGCQIEKHPVLWRVLSAMTLAGLTGSMSVTYQSLMAAFRDQDGVQLLFWLALVMVFLSHFSRDGRHWCAVLFHH